MEFKVKTTFKVPRGLAYPSHRAALLEIFDRTFIETLNADTKLRFVAGMCWMLELSEQLSNEQLEAFLKSWCKDYHDETPHSGEEPHGCLPTKGTW
jgi:hypothetical protein